MQTYKEIIDKNIKEFEEKFRWLLEPIKVKPMFGSDYEKAKALQSTYNSIGDSIKYWHIKSLISFLEEENKRLKGQNKWTQSDLKSPFGHSEDKGYNQAKQEEINHNLEIISYLKKL